MFTVSQRSDTHADLSKICMDAILKTLSLVMNTNNINKIFKMIKQLKMREYSAHFDFSLNCYVLVFLFIQQCLQV